MILYRPVGHRELELIVESGLREFPPRLPDQPIFYPVLNAGYAREIAEGWNTKSEGKAGYITRFVIDVHYARKFETRTVGGSEHKELWVPADELSDFNANIFGHIEVVSAYFGKGFTGSLPTYGLSNEISDADEYFEVLVEVANYNLMDFRGTVVLNHKSIFCNFAYWNSDSNGLRDSAWENTGIRIVDGIAETLRDNFPGISLPCDVTLSALEQKTLS